MWPLNLLLLVLAVVPSISGAAVRTSTPRPLVIWHGMGDSYASPGMVEFGEQIAEMHPGIFIHSVYVDEDQEQDRRAGFYGSVNDQVDLVAEQIANVTELKNGFDAIGFSQGGQFLRAYVERYNTPPVHNLITFGSQHMGVSDIPPCRPWDLLCQAARRAARSSVYSHWAQTNIIQAQYYRDPDRMDSYLANNRFLADINNEVPDAHNATYAKNLPTLNKLVLVLFAKDVTVVPKESSWFGSHAPSDETFPGEKTVIPMRMQELYLHDTIGLKRLDEKDGVVFKTCDGVHMELADDCWRPLVEEFVGAAARGIPRLVVQN